MAVELRAPKVPGSEARDLNETRRTSQRPTRKAPGVGQPAAAPPHPERQAAAERLVRSANARPAAGAAPSMPREKKGKVVTPDRVTLGAVTSGTQAQLRLAHAFLKQAYPHRPEWVESTADLKEDLKRAPDYKMFFAQRNGRPIGVVSGEQLGANHQIDYVTHLDRARPGDPDLAAGRASVEQFMEKSGKGLYFVEVDDQMAKKYKALGFEEFAGAHGPAGLRMMARGYGGAEIPTDPKQRIDLWRKHAQAWYANNWSDVKDKSGMTAALEKINADADNGILTWDSRLPER